MNREETLKRMEELRKEGFYVPREDMIKTPEQIEGIRQSGIINTGVLDEVASKIRAGITTEEIDIWVRDYTESHGATCAPYHYSGYPKHVCTSIDDVVCHGIPSKKQVLEEGMIVNVDVSTIYNGYYSDASRMFVIGETTKEKQKLVDVCRDCLKIGLEQIKPEAHLGDIGFAIEQLANKNGYKVVREYGGHGVGLEFHEDPWVGHYGKKGSGVMLMPGMVFTVEPMLNTRKSGIHISTLDGWTVYTKDKLPSAQWEHTIVVTEDGYEILTY